MGLYWGFRIGLSCLQFRQSVDSLARCRLGESKLILLCLTSTPIGMARLYLKGLNSPGVQMNKAHWHQQNNAILSVLRVPHPFFFLNWIASLVAQLVKNPPAMQETGVRSLGWKDPREKAMATHSSILAWKVPWTSIWDCKESDTTKWL